MIFIGRKKRASQGAESFVAELTKTIRSNWASGISPDFYRNISSLSLSDEIEIPAWTELPSYPLIQPLQTNFWDIIITIAPAVLDYLKSNQEKDALFREIQSDLLAKLTFAASLAKALTAIGEGLDRLNSADVARKVAAVFGYLEQFFDFEGTFVEHKSMATWNRLKTPLASRMNSDQYNKLCHFYMNFSILASICTQNNKKATVVLEKLRVILAGKIDKKAAQKVADLTGEAIQCMGLVANALGEFFEAID